LEFGQEKGRLEIPNSTAASVPQIKKSTCQISGSWRCDESFHLC